MIDPAAARLDNVKDKIARACQESDRDPAQITLVAVSKMHGSETVGQVLAAGQRTFGENRVQEARLKWPDLKARYPGTILHLIGPLQTNKVRDAIDLFDVIETVDRPKLATKLAAEMAARDRPLPCFVQVNTGEEPQKAGVMPADLPALLDHCAGVDLAVAGLMCIPPNDGNPAPHFALLAKLAKRHGLEKLSMGMSGDYETAVHLGATHVRVGAAIFGERPAG